MENSETNFAKEEETPRVTRPASGRKFSARIDENTEKRNRQVLSLVRQNTKGQSSTMFGNDSDENDEDDLTAGNEAQNSDDDDEIQAAAVTQKLYDPKEFDHLSAPVEIKELFKYIQLYSPSSIELEYKLAPFIPDFMPAVGDIDAFIKVTRPDNADSDLGLRVLDEPCTKQSDPAVLHLQLRAATKQSSAKRAIVKRIENASKNPRAIDSWIRDICDLHKSKYSSSFTYINRMPDIDTLMQEWPADVEAQLANVEPSLFIAELDCDLPTLADIVCELVDIPVHESSRIESLHLLFSLYVAVKNSQMKADPATSNFIATS